MSGSLKLSVDFPDCVLHFDDGLCVGYASRQGQDAVQEAIRRRSDALRARLLAHEGVLRDGIAAARKQGLRVLDREAPDADAQLVRISAADAGIRTFHSFCIELRVVGAVDAQALTLALSPALRAIAGA